MKQMLLCLLATIVWQTPLPAQTGSNLVLAAEVFANGKTYKLSPTASERAAGKYDCSSFVQAVLKKEGFNVGGSTGNKINIVLSEADKSKLKELVEASDKKIKGVVSALVESNQGSEISSINPRAKPMNDLKLINFPAYFHSPIESTPATSIVTKATIASPIVILRSVEPG